MDGITFLRKIMAEHPTPVIICSSLTEKGAETTMQALAAGAFAIFTKPSLGVKGFLVDASNDLVAAVRAAAGARVREACEELFADPDGGARGDETVVVVSHVSPIKAAACWSLGMGDEGAWRLYLANASITRITWGPGGPVLAGFNHTPWASGG